MSQTRPTLVWLIHFTHKCEKWMDSDNPEVCLLCRACLKRLCQFTAFSFKWHANFLVRITLKHIKSIIALLRIHDLLRCMWHFLSCLHPLKKCLDLMSRLVHLSSMQLGETKSHYSACPTCLISADGWETKYRLTFPLLCHAYFSN